MRMVVPMNRGDDLCIIVSLYFVKNLKVFEERRVLMDNL